MSPELNLKTTFPRLSCHWQPIGDTRGRLAGKEEGEGICSWQCLQQRQEPCARAAMALGLQQLRYLQQQLQGSRLPGPHWVSVPLGAAGLHEGSGPQPPGQKQLPGPGLRTLISFSPLSILAPL